jgi:hypothetical protein
MKSRELQNLILEKLIAFEKETGLRVEDISLVRVGYLGLNETEPVRVNLTVTLPFRF